MGLLQNLWHRIEEGERAVLFKSADDKSKRLKLLTDLQASVRLDARQRQWLEEEVWRLRRGLEGEREAAFHIDSLMRDAPNTAVLHDLRLVVEGEVAQIDHLVFNRLFDFILIETKCYGGSVRINEAGEFTVRYGSGKLFGVPSPLAQSERHGRVLARLLERLGISGRLGTQPKFHHLAMFHPKAVIERPAARRFDSSNVIKADLFPQWRERWVETGSGAAGLSAMLNLRGRDTLKEWGEMLARQHQPADWLALPDFMQPCAEPPASSAASSAAVPADAGGLVAEPTKRLICAHCGARISYPEGKFCWNHPQRFGGLQYCREHQALFT